MGLPKTGTTHIQLTMAANRRRLAELGLSYPRAARHHPQHFLPVLDFLQVGFGAVEASDVTGLWDRLRSSIDAWPQRVLVSHELLAGADSADVNRLVEQFSPRPVHVIVSVRDLSRLLPAVWQERAKNRVVESWGDFRTDVARGPHADEPHPFWHLHDATNVIRIWRESVPDDQVHVITVPASRSDQGLLLGRFAEVLGIDSGGLTVPSEPANASIGALELAVLRELNVAARASLDRKTYTAQVKRYLVPAVLAKRSGQVRARVAESDRPWIEGYTRELCEMLADSGVQLVGSLTDLEPTNFVPTDPRDPAQTGLFPADVVAHALAEVVVELLAQERATEGAAGPADAADVTDAAERAGGEQTAAARLVDGLRGVSGRARRRLGRRSGPRR